MPPFTASAPTEVQIIQLSTTATGERKRSKASYPSQSESRIRTKALVNAASVPGTMIAVSFFGIGGPFGPAHGEIGNAERGDVGKIVNRVVQKGDAAAENAAKSLRDHQAQRGGHGPAKHGGAQRGMSVAGVTVTSVRIAGGMRMTGVIWISCE